jgi:flagellar protein FlaJ
MKWDRLRNLVRRIKIPGFLVPKRFSRAMEIRLMNANITFSAMEWMGMFSAMGFILLLIGTLVSSLFAGLALFITCIACMVMLPVVQADKRRAKIEKPLPDALHHMSVAIRTGLVVESVIKEIADGNYGVLSDEFSRISIEMKKGRPLKEALLAFSKRSGSKEVGRAMRLVIEGIESGGPISEVLDEVSDDLRAVKMIQRERKTATSQQASFLAMASLMAAPFVMGVVAALPTIMTGMAGEGMFSARLMRQVQGVVTALSYYVFAQAFSGGLLMGVIMYGDFKKGLKYGIPMGMAAYVIFLGVLKVMPSMAMMMG